jgi:penicillin-binding protein 1C
VKGEQIGGLAVGPTGDAPVESDGHRRRAATPAVGRGGEAPHIDASNNSSHRQRRLLACVLALLVAFALWVRCGPLPPELLDPARRVSTEFVDRRGEPLYEALSGEGTRARELSADRLPQALVDATLAAEDRRFFSHPGVDPLAVLRAAWHNARAGRVVEGGSTLTQQVVKLLTRRPRTLAGKLSEMLLALRLEHRLGKREILALYLSVAPYGNQRVGAAAAARGYFATSVQNLTPAQAAFLAGLPQRPSTFNPWRSPEAARRRQLAVLARMQDLGVLGEQDAAVARAEELRLSREAPAFVAPHFVERVRVSLGETPPARVETTLDAALQREVAAIVAAHRERLERYGAANVAVAVLDNASAEWLAWEGSGDWGDPRGGTIDGVVTPRQPGSALKPFTYALAFERDLTPASVLPDVPASFPTAQPGVVYRPRNYDGIFRGPLRARAALAGSENVPAVWTLSQVGVPDLLRLLRRAGLSTLDKTADYYGYALTMGDAEVRLDELVAAYAALARGGLYRQPRLWRRAFEIGGAERLAVEPVEELLVSARAAYWVADVLADSRARSYIFGTGGSLDFPFPVAVKTGTSQSYHDNWTLGFTRDVTVGVWVGNFDRQPLRGASGVVGAAPIFHDVMQAAQRRFGPPPAGEEGVLLRPADLEATRVCALSGLRATPACPVLETEWLPASRELPACLWHRQGGHSGVVWPARYRAWAKERGLLERPGTVATASVPAVRVASPRAAPRTVDGLRIVNPPAGASYLFDPTLRAEFQTLPLRAEAAAGARLAWSVDGHGVGAAGADTELNWPLQRGRHVVSVDDGQGRRDEAVILVR